MVWPLITAGIGLLQGNSQKREQARQAEEDIRRDLLMRRAQQLGADTSEIAVTRDMDAIRQSQMRPSISASQALSLIGGAMSGAEDVDERIAKEMAARGYMRGYQPF